MTIPQLMSRGEEGIHFLFEPEGTEFVGIGRYEELQYQDMAKHHPSYATG